MQSNINTQDGMLKKRRRKTDFSNYMVYIIFAVVMIIFAIWMGTTFFSVDNILNITRQAASTAVMAVAMVMIIGLGQIDLSVGSVVALSAMILGMVMGATNNVFLALVAALGMGAGVGLFNGFAVTKLKIPAFLATLGMMSIIRGISMWTTNTKSVPIFNEGFNNAFGSGSVGPIPVLFLWTIAALLVGHFALTKLPFGKKVMAVGGNPTAAKYTGINVQKVTITVFVIMGVVAAFAGALYAGRMQTARWSYGEGDELDVIAAVILGGTSMSGGSGSVVGAVVGALLMSMINNGLIIGGFSVAQQTIMQGVMIILAIALGNLSKRSRA